MKSGHAANRMLTMTEMRKRILRIKAAVLPLAKVYLGLLSRENNTVVAPNVSASRAIARAEISPIGKL